MRRAIALHGCTACAVLFMFSQVAGAQPSPGQAFSFEVYGSVANGRVFRIEDNPLGSGPNFGAAAGIRHRSGLAAEFEFHRTVGLEPSPAACGIIDVVCEGSARNGVTKAAVASINALYYFGRSRVQPYVTGGVGALMSESVTSILYVQGTKAYFEEQQYRDTGLAFNFGGGLGIRLGGGFRLRPELRVYNAAARSRANLSLLRASIGIGYEFGGARR